MVPMADCYNHLDVQASHNFVVKRMLLEEVDNPYHFNKGRYMCDYSEFFKDELKEIQSVATKSKG